MRRDWMIIKQLLQKFEEETIGEFLFKLMNEQISRELDESEKEFRARVKELEEFKALVLAQLLLMDDAQMISGCEVLVTGRSKCNISGPFPRLTMKGHDTLEALRNQSIWGKVKETAKEKALPITLELIFEVLKVAVKL